MATASVTTSTTTTTTTLPNGVVPQENSRGDTNTNESGTNISKNNITTPGIVNIFQPSLSPNQISFNFNAEEQTKEEVANGYGYIPLVWYNAYQIDAENIRYLSLFNDGIAPSMALTFVDTLGLMKDRAFPLDDTRVTLFLNSRSDQLKPIFLQFKITDFRNNNGILSIDSALDADGLYIKKFKSYTSMTSNQTLQEICKEIGLGFNTNIVDTNDKMTWINTGKKPYNFIDEVLDHTYLSDESFVAGYIDYYYNFNFVDIQKEMSRDINNELGIVSNSLAEILKISDVNNIGRLVLSNDASISGSNAYFYSYRIINESTSTSLKNGYSDVVKYYDMLDKSLLNFNVESLNNNADKSIILKGAPQDETFYKSNQNYIYGGKFDSDNSHKNFNYTKVQNNRNIIDAQKVGIEIELNSPNYNVYKFQKIKLIISSNTPTPAAEMINQRLSGDWFIVDIKYRFFDSALSQVITLIKRELELSDDELNSELISPGKSGGRSNGYDAGRGTYTNPKESVSIFPSKTTPSNVAGRLVGGGRISKNMTFAQVTKEVVINLEGGYYHPNMLKDGRVKDQRYGSSGETMYGLDRKAGGPEINSCAPCRQFWGTLDSIGASRSWKWNYMPGDPLQTTLLNLVVGIMEPLFNKSLNLYVPEKEIQAVIKSDGRLLFNFVYAQWNGPGWFKGWANQIRIAYKNGKTSAEDLLVLFVEKRVDNTGIIGNKSNNSLIAQGGRKIAKIVGVDIA